MAITILINRIVDIVQTQPLKKLLRAKQRDYVHDGDKRGDF